jgi:hypothetical protein
MHESKYAWNQFIEANMNAIMADIWFVWDGVGFSGKDPHQKEMYTFDWYSQMMRKLDTVQNAVMLGPLVDNAAHRLENDMDGLHVPQIEQGDTLPIVKNPVDAAGDNGERASIYSSSWYR